MNRPAHARRIVDSLPPGTRAKLARQPLSALREIGLQIHAVPHLDSTRGAGGMCDGLSFTDHGTILYSPTPDSRRENFTLLHEYAHVLVDQDDDASVWIADLEHPSRELEALCDQIAGLLLIPDTFLDTIVGPGPVTGQHVLELFKESPSASQFVCAIAVARRLTSRGAILLTDRATQTVVFATLVNNPPVFPVAGQDIPHGHTLRLLAPGQIVAVRSFWQTPWGSPQRYYLSASASPKRTYAILAEDDLWNIERFHAPDERQTEDSRPTRTLVCKCGYSGTFRAWPCPDCGQSPCPRCSRCDCQRRAAQEDRCGKCGLTVPRVDLQSGVCSSCR